MPEVRRILPRADWKNHLYEQHLQAVLREQGYASRFVNLNNGDEAIALQRVIKKRFMGVPVPFSTVAYVESDAMQAQDLYAHPDANQLGLWPGYAHGMILDVQNPRNNEEVAQLAKKLEERLHESVVVRTRR